MKWKTFVELVQLFKVTKIAGNHVRIHKYQFGQFGGRKVTLWKRKVKTSKDRQYKCSVIFWKTIQHGCYWNMKQAICKRRSHFWLVKSSGSAHMIGCRLFWRAFGFDSNAGREVVNWINSKRKAPFLSFLLIFKLSCQRLLRMSR